MLCLKRLLVQSTVFPSFVHRLSIFSPSSSQGDACLPHHLSLPAPLNVISTDSTFRIFRPLIGIYSLMICSMDCWRISFSMLLLIAKIIRQQALCDFQTAFIFCQIITTTLAHDDHIFQTNTAEARVIQAGFNRHNLIGF